MAGATVGLQIGIGSTAAGIAPFIQNYTGIYKIAGVALDAGSLVGLQRLIMLSPRGAPTLIVASMYSDPVTGAFLFAHIAPGTYTVIGVDPNNIQNNADAADVVAVPM